MFPSMTVKVLNSQWIVWFYSVCWLQARGLKALDGTNAMPFPSIVEGFR